jgi:uncharacterized protein (DUF1330 family)
MNERYPQIVLVNVTDPEQFARYGALVAPIVTAHGARGDRQVKPSSVHGYGPVTVVNLVSSPSREAFEAFHHDPRFLEIVEMRSRSTTLGSVRGPSLRGGTGESPVRGRLYLVEIAEYGPGGETAYRAYAQEAESVMGRYGWHVERELRPEAWDGLPFRPDLAKVAYFDTPEDMARMERDPAHARLEADYGNAVGRSIWIMGAVMGGDSG